MWNQNLVHQQNTDWTEHCSTPIIENSHRYICLITIHMPQRTCKILLVRLPVNKNALFFQIRVTCFARYTVWFGVTRSDQNTVNDYFTHSRSMITMRRFLLHCASQSAMNMVHYLTRIRFALVLQKIHFTLDNKIHFCGICNVVLYV